MLPKKTVKRDGVVKNAVPFYGLYHPKKSGIHQFYSTLGIPANPFSRSASVGI